MPYLTALLREFGFALIRAPCIAPALYRRHCGASDRASWCALDHPHDRGHFSRDRHPGGAGGVELSGLSAEDMERRGQFDQRAQLFDRRERHQPHRVPGDFLVWACSRFISSPAPISAAPSPRSAPPRTPRFTNAPPGMQPPLIIQFNAANVPVVQMTISSKTLSEQRLFRLWPQLHPHPGFSPSPACPRPLRSAASSARS